MSETEQPPWGTQLREWFRGLFPKRHFSHYRIKARLKSRTDEEVARAWNDAGFDFAFVGPLLKLIHEDRFYSTERSFLQEPVRTPRFLPTDLLWDVIDGELDDFAEIEAGFVIGDHLGEMAEGVYLEFVHRPYATLGNLFEALRPFEPVVKEKRGFFLWRWAGLG